MSKLLLLLGLLAVAYLLLKNRRRTDGSQKRAAHRPANVCERMVSCAYCKLNVPMSESLRQGARHYCCEEHRRLHGAHDGI